MTRPGRCERRDDAITIHRVTSIGGNGNNTDGSSHVVGPPEANSDTSYYDYELKHEHEQLASYVHWPVSSVHSTGQVRSRCGHSHGDLTTPEARLTTLLHAYSRATVGAPDAGPSDSAFGTFLHDKAHIAQIWVFIFLHR